MIVVAELEKTVAFRDGGQAVHVCPSDHKHENATTCYHAHKCRCTPCVVSVNARQVKRRRLKAYGRWQPMLPATRTRNHIRVLRASGVGIGRIAALTGVTASHLRTLSNGVTRLVHPGLELRVLAIAPGEGSIAAGSLVDAALTRRCLQALHCVGWTAKALGDELGIGATNVSNFREADRVTVRTQERVTALYERLWDQAPVGAPAEQKKWRLRAAAAGWVPPLGWDDIYTDEEPPAPDDVDAIDVIAVELAVEGGRVPLTMAERRLAVEQLHALRYSDKLIAQMLLVDAKTIHTDRAALGLPTVEDPVTAREQAA